MKRIVFAATAAVLVLTVMAVPVFASHGSRHAYRGVYEHYYGDGHDYHDQYEHYYGDGHDYHTQNGYNHRSGGLHH